MSRNIKVLGLALVAMLAMSAVVASAASATAFNFKSETVPTQLTGKQHAGNDVFTTDAGKVECTEATYLGEQTVSPVNNVSVVPTYTGCTAFGFANTPIDVNGCSYKFTAITKEAGNFEGAVDIICPAGKVIEVTAFGCTVTIGSQTGLKKVTYTNVGAGTTREVTVDVNLTGIKYEEHNKGIFPTCANNTVATTNGTYVGAGLVTGENPGTKAHHGIFVE
jgi:hypothetical protein